MFKENVNDTFFREIMPRLPKCNLAFLHAFKCRLRALLALILMNRAVLQMKEALVLKLKTLNQNKPSRACTERIFDIRLLSAHVQQNIFGKTLIKVCSSHIYASFGTFCVQIGQLFAPQ